MEFGLLTNDLGNMCHNCKICPTADKKPDSAFGKTMRWHREWCPGYSAHIRMYGEKALSK